MLTTVFNEQPVFVCTAEPNWGKVEAQFRTLTSLTAGKTNREEREALAGELRTTLKFSAMLDAAESVALRAALDAWDNRPVLCPFWPAAKLHSSATQPSVTGTLKVWFEPGFSTWSLGIGAGPSGFVPSAQCMVAPVMWGRFGSFPTLTTIDGADDNDVSFEIVETGAADYALRPRIAALSTTVVNTLQVPILTVPFAWGRNQAVADVRIKRGNVGWGRADADDYRPQPVRTKQTMLFDGLDGDGVAYLLTLFRDRCGSVKPWQCPANKDGETLSLGRFWGDMLKLTWTNPTPGEWADCSVEFVSLPTEAVELVGEKPGVNIGGTPARWFGYVVTDGAQTWRYTSYERVIDGPGGTFEPRSISHGTITEEINLAVGDCTLEVQNWAGSPWTRLRNQPSAPDLTVSIYEGLVSDPAAAQLIYTGTARAPDTDGPRWEIKLVGPGALLDLKGPRRVMQEACVACLGDAKCGLDLASISVTKTLLSIDGDSVEFLDAAGLAPHRFAAGEARRTINGQTQRYLIVDSTTNALGNLVCVIADAIIPRPTAAETGWVLVPGCDGSKAVCKGFGNFVNFRGIPNLPKTDPVFVQIPASTGGKK